MQLASVSKLLTCSDGTEISSPRGVLEIRGDQPTRHWSCDRRPRADLSSRPSLPSSWHARTLLCGVTVVVTEQTAQSLTTSHRPVGTADGFFCFEQSVPQSLMVALSVIMMDELGDGTVHRLCTEAGPKLSVLPLLSVGEMTLRLYGAFNYSQNSAR